MTDLSELTLTQAITQLRQGETTSLALTEAMLARIERLNPTINAYLTVTADLARKQAAAADRALAAWRDAPDTSLPPLTGVPLAVKDVLCTRGISSTAGSRILEGFKPPYNATVIDRLEQAGVVLLGKTNTDEFAMGSSTENSAYVTTTNPWDTTRVPGGSSGGSAATVAARMAYGALGTDTGGSIRQPAAFTGVVGLKPSYGRVSRWGLIAFASSLDQIGPFGRTVSDVACLFNAIAGHDPKDSTSMDTPVPDAVAALDGATDLKGVRVGVPRRLLGEGLNDEVRSAVLAAIDVLVDLGAELKDVDLPHADYGIAAYYIIAPAEASANLARLDGIRYGPRRDTASGLLDLYKANRGQGFGPEVKRRIMLGTYALSAGYYDAYYLKAQQVRTLLRQDYDAAFGEVDIIAGPVTPTTAFRVGEKTADPLAMYLNDAYTIPANMAGITALSVPCGFDSQGLPVGLHLSGPAFGELAILRAAHAYERVNNWWQQTPALPA